MREEIKAGVLEVGNVTPHRLAKLLSVEQNCPPKPTLRSSWDSESQPPQLLLHAHHRRPYLKPNLLTFQWGARTRPTPTCGAVACCMA